mgnify:FL=1
MFTSPRYARSTVLTCAAYWLLVGLTLADLLHGVDNASVRHAKIVMLIGFAIAGVFSILHLWNALSPADQLITDQPLPDEELRPTPSSSVMVSRAL